MSRSGYSYDLDPLELGRWRAAVSRALRGRRGQAALRELAQALDAMPEKRLVAGSFSAGCGVCTLGALAAHRGGDVSDMEPYVQGDEVNGSQVSRRFNIAKSMVKEIMFMNDEWVDDETPGQRWSRMRAWVVSNIRRDSQSEKEAIK